MVLEKDHPYTAFISQPDLKHDRLEHLRAQPSQHAGQAGADDIYGQNCKTSRQQPLETKHLSERGP